MTEKTQEATFIPAFFLDVVPKGYEFPSSDWPRHITLFPPLERAYDPAFGERLREQFNQHHPFIVRTAGEDYFGPERDIPVRRLEPSLSLQGMHYLIEQAIGELYHDTTYRHPYNPHISLERLTDVPRNHSIFISGLSIVEKHIGGVWCVVDKVGLKGEPNETR